MFIDKHNSQSLFVSYENGAVLNHPVCERRKMSVIVLLMLEEMESLHARRTGAPHRSVDIKAVI